MPHHSNVVVEIVIKLVGSFSQRHTLHTTQTTTWIEIFSKLPTFAV